MTAKNGKLSSFRPATENANKHTSRGLKALADSMSEVGYVAPITTAADGEVLDGSARLETAFDKFGDDALVIHHDGTKPVVMVRDDIPNAKTKQAKKIAYASNRVGQIDLSWDPLQLAADLEAGLDLSDLFDTSELSEILEAAGSELLGGNGDTPQDVPPEIDRAAELGQKWGTATGQVWQIDNHFVICGDCRKADTWGRLLQAAGVDKINGVFTSPPYAEQRKQQYGGVPTGEYVQWWEAVQANVSVNLAGDGSFFVNIKAHSENGQRSLYVFDLVCSMVRQFGWFFVDELIWNNQGVPGEWKNKFKNAFEPVYHFASLVDCKFNPGNVSQVFSSDLDKMDTYGGPGSKWKSSHGSSYNGHNVRSNKYDGALPSNVIKAACSSEVGHSGSFPVALPTFFVKAYSDPCDVWIDPFLGSGTTIVAAHNEGRRGLGIEQKPEYIGVILERLQKTTGKQPQLLT